VDCEGVGISWWALCCSGRIDRAAASSCAERDAEQAHEARRESSARSVTAQNYSCVGIFGDIKAITAHRDAKPTGQQPHTALAAYPTSPVRHDPSEGGE
jgi:hypothetical protein